MYGRMRRGAAAVGDDRAAVGFHHKFVAFLAFPLLFPTNSFPLLQRPSSSKSLSRPSHLDQATTPPFDTTSSTASTPSLSSLLSFSKSFSRCVIPPYLFLVSTLPAPTSDSLFRLVFAGKDPNRRLPHHRPPPLASREDPLCARSGHDRLRRDDG
jgi:hypothetical protein